MEDIKKPTKSISFSCNEHCVMDFHLSDAEVEICMLKIDNTLLLKTALGNEDIEVAVSALLEVLNNDNSVKTLHRCSDRFFVDNGKSIYSDCGALLAKEKLVLNYKTKLYVQEVRYSPPQLKCPDFNLTGINTVTLVYNDVHIFAFCSGESWRSIQPYSDKKFCNLVLKTRGINVVGDNILQEILHGDHNLPSALTVSILVDANSKFGTVLQKSIGCGIVDFSYPFAHLGIGMITFDVNVNPASYAEIANCFANEENDNILMFGTDFPTKTSTVGNTLPATKHSDDSLAIYNVLRPEPVFNYHLMNTSQTFIAKLDIDKISKYMLADIRPGSRVKVTEKGATSEMLIDWLNDKSRTLKTYTGAFGNTDETFRCSFNKLTEISAVLSREKGVCVEVFIQLVSYEPHLVGVCSDKGLHTMHAINLFAIISFNAKTHFAIMQGDTLESLIGVFDSSLVKRFARSRHIMVIHESLFEEVFDDCVQNELKTLPVDIKTDSRLFALLEGVFENTDSTPDCLELGNGFICIPIILRPTHFLEIVNFFQNI